MQFSDIPVPDIYKSSSDFRFFLDWFSECLSKLQYDTDNIVDLIDPQRCPTNLLWLLCDTIGYKYNDKLPPAFNRLVILYFMSMIYNRGSSDGVTLAAEVNLAQFSIINYGKENPALEERLEDTSIPVNSVYVTSNRDKGYIDIVYFSENLPKDACLEYVRPLGMYCFHHAGVKVDARTKISVDARLTNRYMTSYLGPSRVADYKRSDYASLQPAKYKRSSDPTIKEKTIPSKERNKAWYRNADSESKPNEFWDFQPPTVNAGYRSLYSLQLCNNEHIVKSLVPSGQDPEAIFTIGYGPQDVSVHYPDEGVPYNLLYDKTQEESMGNDIYTIDSDRSSSITNPRPAVNPVMSTIGDAISLNPDNTKYTTVDSEGKISTEDV